MIKQNIKQVNAVEFVNIKKEFLNGKIIANNKVSFVIKKNTIHAIAGENGAGKSTLLSMLFGIYKPTIGSIKVNGNKVNYSSALDAMSDGIGMVHQHFQLVERFTVLENIILGHEPSKYGFITKKDMIKTINETTKKYGFNISAKDKISNLSVGQQQKVEILKLLIADSKIMIFDEPTAMLTPKEIKELISIILKLKKQGKTIIIITHKLDEIKALADEVSVLRKGEYVGSIKSGSLTPNKLSKMMIGRSIKQLKLPKVKQGSAILEVNNLSIYKNKILKLKDISLSIHGGEIFAIGGVEGNGQVELVEAISGLVKHKEGEIFFEGEDIKHKSIFSRYLDGISHIPEDRHKYGMALDMTVSDNMLIRDFRIKPFSCFGLMNKKAMRNKALEIIEQFDVRGTDKGNAIARGLSGGNQQKAVVGRELANDESKLVIIFQATRGLDVGAIEYIHSQIVLARSNGKAILLVSYDINEIMALADKVAILNSGEITGTLERNKMTAEKIGVLFSKKAKGVKNV